MSRPRVGRPCRRLASGRSEANRRRIGSAGRALSRPTRTQRRWKAGFLPPTSAPNRAEQGRCQEPPALRHHSPRRRISREAGSARGSPLMRAFWHCDLARPGAIALITLRSRPAPMSRATASRFIFKCGSGGHPATRALERSVSGAGCGPHPADLPGDLRPADPGDRRVARRQLFHH